jgi:tetratricopeptide (TPR) repeat protein
MKDTALRDEVRAVEADIAERRPEQALARCQELQERYPRALIVQRLVGETYLALQKPREALGALERALEGDPEDARACCARALIHQVHGDATAALAWYRRACEIRPEDTTLRKAFRELAASLSQPAYRPTSVGLARLYMRGDLFVHAEREWESILAQQPDRLDAQVGLAETLWRAGKTERANDTARRILNNIRTCVKALLIVAAMEHAAGHDGEAEQLLQRAAELDPERRIGRALYADCIAAGDTALEAMLLGSPAASAVGSDGRARVTGGLAPALADVPTAHIAAVNASGQSAGARAAGSGALSSPTLPATAQADLQEVNAFAQSRVTAIPRDFHEIFAETEFMIWGREDEEAQARAMQGHAGPASATGATSTPPNGAPTDSVPAFERSRTDRFERSTGIVPPALAGAEGSMDDTEARAAIGWVRWLQAQGARPIDGGARSGPTRSGAGGTGPLRLAGGTGPLQPTGGTGPLVPPTRESLREMFAQLDPAGPEPRVVDAAPSPQAASASGSLATSGSGPTDAAARAASADGVEPAVSRGGKAGRLRDPADSFADSAQYEAVSSAQIPVAPARSDQDSQPPGHEARADLASGGDGAGRAETSGRDVFLAERPSFDPAAISGLAPRAEPSVEHADADESAAPIGDDYLSRLRLARRKRAQGRMDEALLEYRGILHNSPDTLDDLIHDLRDMVTESEDPEVHRLLGDAYIREGNYLNALESYNRALALTQSQGG